MAWLHLFYFLSFPTGKIHHLRHTPRCPDYDPDDLLISVIDFLMLSIGRDEGPISRVHYFFLLVPILIE